MNYSPRPAPPAFSPSTQTPYKPKRQRKAKKVVPWGLRPKARRLTPTP